MYRTRLCSAFRPCTHVGRAFVYVMCTCTYLCNTQYIQLYICIYTHTHTCTGRGYTVHSIWGNVGTLILYTHRQMYTRKHIYTTYTSIHKSITYKPMHVHIQTFTGRGNEAYSNSGRIGTRVCHWSP